jgi:hypothetical protein
MKQLLIGTMAVLLTAHGAFAASRTVTGTTSDSLCGASHQAMAAQHSRKGTDAECSEACVKAGRKYVFVSGGQVYTIANPDVRNLAANAGKTVELRGDLQGTTITVAKMAASMVKAATEAPPAPSGLRLVSP